MAGQPQPITLELLYNTVISNHQEVMKTNAEFNNRLKNIEEKTDFLATDQNTLRHEMNDLQTEMRNSLNEEILRLRKISNLILMGVPETDEGINCAKRLIQQVLPKSHSHIEIENIRIGKVAPDKKNPRPLRIQLSNPLEKKTALKNCFKLAGINEFKGISVRPDLTRLQQETARRTPVRTRSSTKRKQDEAFQEGSQAKRTNNTQDLNMDTTSQQN